MVDTVTLSCPSCGGKLQIGKDLERFACSYCGNEHIVKRSGGLVSLSPVIDSLSNIEVGVDKTAAELAIRRLREDIANLNKKLDNENERHAGKAMYGVILSIIGGITLFGAFVSEAGYTFALIGLVCLIFGVRMIITGMKGTSEEKRLEELIKAKKADLRHHESIVK